MSRRELAVASHREREHTIGLAKPTYGTTAALPRAFAAGGHVTNRPCRAPCACMPPEAVALATVLAYPGHEPSRREPVVAGHRERKPAQPNNLKIQSIQCVHMARFCSIERSPSRSPDETLPTRLPRANLLLRVPLAMPFPFAEYTTRANRTQLRHSTPLAPCRIRRIAADRRASRCRPPARRSTPTAPRTRSYSTVKDQRPCRLLPGLVANAVKHSAAPSLTCPTAPPPPAYKRRR